MTMGLSAPIVTAQTTLLKISAGTGFVVNPNGNVVTNAHVVRNCQSMTVLTPHGDTPATLIASDETHDLAVLDVHGLSGVPMAPLRWNIKDLKVNDPVEMIGFPGQAGMEGHVTFKKTTVTSLVGPTGEPLWIQLASVAEHGNSGGPVLDGSGNVIAVISGMAQTYRLTADGKPEAQPIQQSDVAITMASLQDFLNNNRVSFYESASGMTNYDDRRIEENALKFIVSVRCVQSKTNRD